MRLPVSEYLDDVMVLCTGFQMTVCADQLPSIAYQPGLLKAMWKRRYG